MRSSAAARGTLDRQLRASRPRRPIAPGAAPQTVAGLQREYATTSIAAATAGEADGAAPAVSPASRGSAGGNAAAPRCAAALGATGAARHRQATRSQAAEFGRRTYKIWWSRRDAHLIIAPIIHRCPSRHPIRDSSDHRRPRFRLAVHPVDCAPAARAVGLLGDPAVRHAAGRDPRRAPVGDHPVGRAEERVAKPARRTAMPAVFDAGVPVLGICYGMQLMTDALGGEVAPAPHREFGLATITIEPDAPLFASVPTELRVWASHGDFVKTAPPGFAVTATSANAPVAAMAAPDRAALRAAVPSGGRAHRSRPRHPPQLRVRHLRLHRRLDDGVVRRGGDRADPRAGGRRARGLRPERRRRLDRRGAARFTGRSAIG